MDSFEEQPPYEKSGDVLYARAQISKTFPGDLQAQGNVEMLSVRAEPDGAGYVAVERIVGTLHGKLGSFALLHIGTMRGKTPWAKWPIVPGSGGGELKGISGEARIEIDPDGAHTLYLDYELA